MSDLHEALTHVASLLGTWSGAGDGEYPTIEPFRYSETVTFGHVGKPFLAYAQRTRALGHDGTEGPPLHAETGYWRFPGPSGVEVVLSHPSGITEIQEGSLAHHGDALVIELRSTSVVTTSTAKSVIAVERSFRLDGDVLDYTLAMAAVGVPMTHHLSARLHRV